MVFAMRKRQASEGNQDLLMKQAKKQGYEKNLPVARIVEREENK